jgi:hypothetical protein
MNAHHVLLRQIVAEVRPEMDKEEEVLDVDKSMETSVSITRNETDQISRSSAVSSSCSFSTRLYDDGTVVCVLVYIIVEGMNS